MNDPVDSTAQAAVDVLKAELALVNASIDSLDRKAALIPTLLVAAAAFLLGPPATTTYTALHVALALSAFSIGVWACVEAYRTMAPDEIRLGPDAEILVRHLDAPTYQFQQRVAEALAVAVSLSAHLTVAKGERLSRSMRLAGATLLLLVVIRASGGIGT